MSLSNRLAVELARASKRASSWRDRRDALILRAHDEGASLREIAAAAGLSNPGVLRIVRRESGRDG